MGLDRKQQIFLTQDDQEAHEFNQFQTKYGESFDFREGYDAAVYEIHKQYKLRRRTIDVPQPTNLKDTKHPKKIKDKVVPTESSDKTYPKEVTVEDVSDLQPSRNHSFTSHSLTEALNNPLENNFKSDVPHNNTHNQEKVNENSAEKEKLAAQNIKI